METRPNRVLHVVPIALADPQDQSGELGEIIQNPPDEPHIVGFQLRRIVAHGGGMAGVTGSTSVVR